MQTMKNPHKLFNTDGQIFHGTSTTSGDFNTFIDIATITGNNGSGPTIDLKLFYNRNFIDYIFGNWSLNFTHAIYQHTENHYTSTTDKRGEVFLNNGESWRWDGEGDISTPSVLVKPSHDGFIITQKNGEITVLESIKDFTTVEAQWNMDDLLITHYLPTKIISPSGETLTLKWSNHNYTMQNGANSTTPQLDSISDKSSTLLTVRYSTNQQENSVTFDIYPNTANHHSHTLDIESFLNPDDDSEKHFGIVKSVQTNPQRTQNFSYFISPRKFLSPRALLNLKKITHTSGIIETLEYTDDYISSHTIKNANFTNIQKNSFSYKTTPHGYSTKLVNSDNNHIESFFDNDNQQTKQILSHNGHTTTTSTKRTLKKSNNTNTPDTIEVLTTTTYENPSRQSRTEEIKVTLDVLGNIVSKIENGVVTEWTYYRGMPKEETLVKAETYTDISGVVAKVALIGDYLHPIGWGFLLFGKAGLTWGTREIRTVTHSPFVTSGGRITYNLPVDIGCPGDPNYFRTYVESEKVYTVQNGQRVDLQWTFYGYDTLPVKGNLVKGPAVKPTTKLTIRNPVTNGKALTSWQNGSMTLERTSYVTDVNSPHHGRISSTSQRILDASGNEVPNSKVATTFAYSLAGEQLTTHTTIIAGNALSDTQSETIQLLTGQLMESVDTKGNKTTYRYDADGRLIEQTLFASDPRATAPTRFSYTDSTSESTVTQTSPLNEQIRNVYDSMGRLIRSQRLHSDNWTWLTLTEIAYGMQDNEETITDYDYRPDGSQLFSHTRHTRYSSSGVRTEWANGLSKGSEYDPVSQQHSEWTAQNDKYTGSVSKIIDEPGGGQREEEFLFANDQLISSRTRVLNVLGQLVEESSSESPTRQYRYDAFGRLTHITVDDVVTVNDYPAHILSQGASTARLESRGQIVALGTQSIDSRGRITATTLGGQSTSYSYVDNENWGKASRSSNRTATQSNTITFESDFDPSTRKATETVTGGVRSHNNNTSRVTYVYSLQGLLLNETDAFGNTSDYVYNDTGQLVGLTNSTLRASFSYGVLGRLEHETLTDLTTYKTLTTVYSYDAQGRETQRQFTADGFKPLTLRQSYANSSRIASQEVLVDDCSLRTEEFNYNTKGQLAAYQCTGWAKPITATGLIVDQQAFSYDLAGNITQCIQTSSGSTFADTFQYSALDPCQLQYATRLTANGTQITEFKYDSLGFLEANNNSTLQYNTRGQLASINEPRRQYEYFYDSTGCLMGCAGTYYYDQFFYKGDVQYARQGVFVTDRVQYQRTSVVLNQSPSGLLLQQRITPSGGTPQVSHSFELKDLRGTVIASYDLNREQATIFAYTPFGYRPHTLDQRSWLGFNGEPIDSATGNYHLGNGARVYNPAIQVFESPDPLSPFGVGGANRYSYCHNDPVNYSDPSGYTEVVNQYTVITHSPATQDPVVQAVMFGVLGVALSPFTGGASLGWTAAAVGLAVVSAGFGIASAVLQESDPRLSEIFGWTSLGSGMLGAGAGVLGSNIAKAAARTAVRSTVAESASASRAGARGPQNLQLQMIKRNGADIRYEFYSGGKNVKIAQIEAHGYPTDTRFNINPGNKVRFSAPKEQELSINDTAKFEQIALGKNNYNKIHDAWRPRGTPDYLLSEITAKDLVNHGLFNSEAELQKFYSEMAIKHSIDIIRPIKKSVVFSELLATLQAQDYEIVNAAFCRGPIPPNLSLQTVKNIRHSSAYVDWIAKGRPNQNAMFPWQVGKSP